MIEFYILDVPMTQLGLTRFCQWVESIYNTHPTCMYIQTNSLEEAEKLDNLFWIFRDDSFLPHAIYHPDNPIDAPIQIGWQNVAPQNQHILFNLANNVPDFYQQVAEIKEMIFASPESQALGRERYRHYRHAGLNINTHKIKLSEIANQ